MQALIGGVQLHYFKCEGDVCACMDAAAISAES